MNLKDIGETFSMLRKKIAGCLNDDPRIPLLITVQILKTAFMSLVLMQEEIVAILNIEQSYSTAVKMLSALLVPLGIIIIVFGLFDRLLAKMLKLPILEKRWQYCNQGDCLAAINFRLICQGNIAFLIFVIPLLISAFLLDYHGLKKQEDQEKREKHLSMLR